MISFTKAFISTILFVGGSFFIPGPVEAGDSGVQAPFNVGEVIERVSHHPRMEGDRIIIQDRAYEAGFREGRNRALAGEFLLDTTVVYVPAEGRQWFPSVAFDGVNYLVVWEDSRNGWNGLDIYGTRVSRDGRILDEAGIVISASLGNQQTPSVAFDGTNFLVVWMDLRGDRDIYGARVSPGGVVLDPEGIPITTATNEQWSPSITFGGSNYFVVWMDPRSNGFHIYGARVNPDGVVLDTSGIAIITTPGWQETPSVAFDGLNYLVVWEDYRAGTWPDIYGSRVSQDGVVLDTTGIAISTRLNRVEEEPSVAFDGTNYLVTWKDGRSSTYDIYAARISQGGVVLDSNGIAVSTAAYDQFEPTVAFDGMNYLLVWEDHRSGPNRDIYGSRVTPGGAVLDTSGIPISSAANHQWNPALVFDGANYVVVWWDNRSGTDVYGARMSKGGIVLDTNGIALATAANHQVNPVVSFDGTNYLVLWQDYHSGSWFDLYGVRISSSGRMLDSAGFAISTRVNHQLNPAVAFDGTNYLVVWKDDHLNLNDIYGARVTPTGVTLDTAGFPITFNPYYEEEPSIAFDGTNYLIVWEDKRDGRFFDIWGARVSPSGQVVDPDGFIISTATYDQWKPSIAFDGTNYLVVWQDSRNTVDYDIYGARVSPSGVVLDTAGIAISVSPNNQLYPSLAFDGENYLIAWADWRHWMTFSDIYGARLRPDGVVLDTSGIPITIAPDHQLYPTIAYNGGDYIVVWQDSSNQSATDLYGAKVDSSGAVIDTFTVSLQSGNQNTPTIAHGNADQLLVAYSGYIDFINGHPVLTQRAWGTFLPGPSGVKKEGAVKGIVMRPSLRIYPNPFREKAWVSVNVPGRLKVYDALGRLVREFPKETEKPGPLVWDGRDEKGRKLPGGVYFLRYEHGTGCETRKAILIR